MNNSPALKIYLPGVDARSDARPPSMRPVADSILKSGTHSWEEIGHENISMTIIFLLLIEEECAGELLAKECALTILVNCLGGLPRNSIDRLTDRARNDLKSVKASKSRKIPTLQQNTFKGLGSRTCRIGPVHRQNIKVAQQKWHRTFLCAEHFYFLEQHLFSCVNPLLLCYRVPNMSRVAFFFFPFFLFCFDDFWSFLRL